MKNQPPSPIVAEICELFHTLKETKKKKTLMNTLSKMFCVLCQEKMKKKLLFTCKIENEKKINMEHFFKNKNIIIDIQKPQPLKEYEKWINECFEKYIQLLLQLLHNEDEVLVKKSLMVLFACLQYESKIFQKLQNKDQEEQEMTTMDLGSGLGLGMGFGIEMEKNKGNEENEIRYFPFKLYLRIVTSLLKVKTFSISVIKHICKNYICAYYDLNYFFLFIFKILSMEKEKLKESRTNAVMVQWRENIREEKRSNQGFSEETNEKSISDREKELNDIFIRDSDTNLFLYSILINSVKPKEKEDPSERVKMKYLKPCRIEFCFDLDVDVDEEEVQKRKRTFGEMNTNVKNVEKGKKGKKENKEKKDILNYNSDDSIIHLSSDSDENIGNETFIDKIEIMEREDKDNDDYVSDESNYSEEFNNEYSKIIEEELQKMKKLNKNVQNKIDRKNSLFLNISINDKIYAHMYSRSWFYFITLFNHNYRMTLRLLHSIPSYIFPYTTNRYYLIDFFNYSFYSSPNLYVSLAALPGIFYILTKLNIGDIVDNNREGSASGNEEEIEEEEDTENTEGTDDTESEEKSEEDKDAEGEDETEEQSKTEKEDETEESEKEKERDMEKFKLNTRMYTDYYQRLYELITPASFYYFDTDFLKIIFTSLKNKMIPLHYITSFLKKLLRVGCLTANNFAINILCGVYDIINFFRNELHDALFVSASLFMNLDIRKDFFCYEDLNDNCDMNKIKEMFKREVLQTNQGSVEEQTQDEEKIMRNEQEQEQVMSNEQVISNEQVMSNTTVTADDDDDVNKYENYFVCSNKDKEKTHITLEKNQIKESEEEQELFSLQDCLPEKYKMKVKNVDDEKLRLANQMFYEIILLNNHLCYNLRQYANLYYFGFQKKSSMLDFYVDPQKIDWKPENAFFFFLKDFLNLKEKKEVDVLPSHTKNSFSTLFI